MIYACIVFGVCSFELGGALLLSGLYGRRLAMASTAILATIALTKE